MDVRKHGRNQRRNVKMFIDELRKELLECGGNEASVNAFFTENPDPSKYEKVAVMPCDLLLKAGEVIGIIMGDNGTPLFFATRMVCGSTIGDELSRIDSIIPN